MAQCRGTFANITHIIVSLLKALLGDLGKDSVQQCHLLTSFQEGLAGDRGRDKVRECQLSEIVFSRKKSFFFKILQARWQTQL